MPTRPAVAAVMLISCLALRDAHAFCGFYIDGAGRPMFADATQVVLMRMGTRTVLSMQNNYKGPAEDFAMVIPVPVVLHEGDVKVLKADVFARVDKMGAPRLVEYWEEDPCAQSELSGGGTGWGTIGTGRYGTIGHGSGGGVVIEAKFDVAEYQIVILSAKESTALDRWLREQKYKIPAGVEPLLRPYVEAGMKFFVAKVNPKKVKFDHGRAALSPLRFHYDADEFSLPIRLGLASSKGTQDLIVNILAPAQRYEVANYPNVTLPTNLDVKPAVKGRFGEFYASLFDATIKKHPGAVVTEYAWQASTCDPCPGETLTPDDFEALGADELSADSGELVLTRLHARYGKDVRSDLVFRAATPITGGRENWTGKTIEHGATPAKLNNFQGRYAIRHPWTGEIKCKSPVRGVWGAPPDGREPDPVAATGLAYAARGKVRLPRFLNSDVPELRLKAYRKPRR